MQDTFTPVAVQSTGSLPNSRPNWRELTWNFPNELDCLASFLALEAAEVLAGAKPANLVQLRNRRQPCGRNLHQLWRDHGEALLTDSPLEALPLRSKYSGDLMLYYSPGLLRAHLQKPETAGFLRQLGYQFIDLQNALEELKRRFQINTEIPHEIGLFLGYPLKDVAGFMGFGDKPCTACRMWRIYGDPKASLALSDRYANCRRGMAEQLCGIHDPVALLRKPANTAVPAYR